MSQGGNGGDLDIESDIRIRLGLPFCNHTRGIGKTGLLHPENGRCGGTTGSDQVADEQPLFGHHINARQTFRLDHIGWNIAGQQRGIDRNTQALAALQARCKSLEGFAFDHHRTEAVARFESGLAGHTGEFLLDLAKTGFKLCFGFGQAVETQRQFIDSHFGLLGQTARLAGFGHGLFCLFAEIAGGLGQLGGNLLQQVVGCIRHDSSSWQT